VELQQLQQELFLVHQVLVVVKLSAQQTFVHCLTLI